MLAQEFAYGFVAVRRTPGEDFFLVVEQHSGWSFPKGHVENDESPEDTARRELFEETGVTTVTVVPETHFIEEYVYVRSGIQTQKKNTYFLALIDGEVELRPQAGEILECKWATFTEALALFPTENRKQILTDAKEALSHLPRS